MAGTSFRIQRQIEKEKSAHEESKAGTCEFSTAAKEAVACGARVLLGDRDFEVRFKHLSAGRAGPFDSMLCDSVWAYLLQQARALRR